MARGKTEHTGMVVAKEAIVINVGARAPGYEYVDVINKRTGLKETIPKDEPIDPGEEGIPYAFKAFQRVHSSHPAVEANPDAFMPADMIDPVDQVVA